MDHFLQIAQTILFFDSSEYVLRILEKHWLLGGFGWGLFVLRAKRSKAKWDDDLVALVKDLKNEKEERTSL